MLGPSSLVLLLRFTKFVGLVLLAMGIGQIFQKSEQRKRALLLFGTGIAIIWGCGFGLLQLANRSFLETWIWLSLLLSLVSLNAMAYLCGRADRNGVVARMLLVTPIVLTLALMVTKPR